MLITGQFNDSLPPIMDGVAITAWNYAYWINRNHGPSFAIGPQANNAANTEDPGNVLRYVTLPLQFAGPYRLGFPRIDRKFNRLIDSIPFDLVHAHCPFVSGNYAYSRARQRKIPLVATFHSKYRDDFASIMKLNVTIDQAVAMVVRFYEKADAVWVPNEGIIETFRQYGYQGPIDLVPNGSDIGLGDSEDPASLKQEGAEFMKLRQDVPTLLYVGQLRWIKNHEMLINALALLRDSGQDFDMCFVGGGSDQKEMETLVQKRRLGGMVRFCGPVYDRKLLRSIYAAADLFLFPSLYDNASLATREAAGFYVPTVFVKGATTARGIIHGESGYLPENNAESYARCLQQVLADREGLRRCGRGAREFLYQPWETIAGIAYAKYEEIVDAYKWQQLRGLLKQQAR